MDLGKTVKTAVEKRGMLAWQFNTIGVSDAITMGSEGTVHVLPRHLQVTSTKVSLPSFVL